MAEARKQPHTVKSIVVSMDGRHHGLSLHHLCKKLIMIVLFVGGCLILFQELSQRASLTANHNTITWRLPDVYNGTNA